MEGSSLLDYKPCCSLTGLRCQSRDSSKLGTEQQGMRREAWGTLAMLQPSQAGVQAAAGRGSGKEAAKPIQPRDALRSSR